MKNYRKTFSNKRLRALTTQSQVLSILEAIILEKQKQQEPRYLCTALYRQLTNLQRGYAWIAQQLGKRQHQDINHQRSILTLQPSAHSIGTTYFALKEQIEGSGVHQRFLQRTLTPEIVF